MATATETSSSQSEFQPHSEPECACSCNCDTKPDSNVGPQVDIIGLLDGVKVTLSDYSIVSQSNASLSATDTIYPLLPGFEKRVKAAKLRTDLVSIWRRSQQDKANRSKKAVDATFDLFGREVASNDVIRKWFSEDGKEAASLLDAVGYIIAYHFAIMQEIKAGLKINDSSIASYVLVRIARYGLVVKARDRVGAAAFYTLAGFIHEMYQLGLIFSRTPPGDDSRYVDFIQAVVAKASFFLQEFWPGIVPSGLIVSAYGLIDCTYMSADTLREMTVKAHVLICYGYDNKLGVDLITKLLHVLFSTSPLALLLLPTEFRTELVYRTVVNRLRWDPKDSIEYLATCFLILTNQIPDQYLRVRSLSAVAAADHWNALLLGAGRKIKSIFDCQLLKPYLVPNANFQYYRREPDDALIDTLARAENIISSLDEVAEKSDLIRELRDCWFSPPDITWPKKTATTSQSSSTWLWTSLCSHLQQVVTFEFQEHMQTLIRFHARDRNAMNKLLDTEIARRVWDGMINLRMSLEQTISSTNDASRFYPAGFEQMQWAAKCLTDAIGDRSLKSSTTAIGSDDLHGLWFIVKNLRIFTKLIPSEFDD